MFFRWLAAWSQAHRGALLAVVAALTIAALVALPQLRFDFQPTTMLQFSDEEDRYAQAFDARYELHDDNVLLLVVRGGERGAMLTPSGLTLLGELTALAEHSGLARHVRSLTNQRLLPTPTRAPATDAAAPGALRVLVEGVTGALREGLELIEGLDPPRLLEGLPATEADVAEARQLLMSSLLLRGNLVSVDNDAALVVMELQPRYVDLELLAPELEAFEARVEAAVAQAPGFEVLFGGLPDVRVATVRNLKRDQLTFWPLVGGLFFLLMLVLFRSVWQAALPLAVVGLATAWLVGLIAYTGYEVNIINNITPTLILVVGACDGIHLMMRINALRREGLGAGAAARAAVEELGLPCLLTSLTSAIGFASLLIARADVLQSFGWQVAVGIMMAYLCIVVVLPLAVSFARRPLPAAMQGARDGLLERVLDRLTRAVLRRPWWVVSGAVALLVGSVYVGTFVPIDARAIEAFHEGDAVYETNQLIERSFGGALPLELEVIASEPGAFTQPEVLARVARLQREVERGQGVLRTMSLLDLLAETRLAARGELVDWRSDAATLSMMLPLLAAAQPGELAHFVSEDRQRLRISARLADQGIRKTLALVEDLQARAPALLTPPAGAPPDAPSLRVRMTGPGYLAAVGLNEFVRDLFWSLVTATGIIFVVLVLFFRSLRVGLVSVLPNALPLAVTLALMPLYGYELNTSSVVIFTISIGLAVDNAIHFISRFRELRPLHDNLEEAVRASFRSAGRAIIASNAMLVIGFSALALSDFEPSVRVAVLTVTTIICALVAALIVLPALIVLSERVGTGIAPELAPDETPAT